MHAKRILLTIFCGLGLFVHGQAPDPKNTNQEKPSTEIQKQVADKEQPRQLSSAQEKLRERLGTQVFNIVDTNRDGSIDIDEFRAFAPKYFFRRVDMDRDGKVTREEWLQGKAAGGQYQNARRFRGFFMADQDLDGRLSRSEFDGSNFEALDLNQDSYLTLHEWKRRDWDQRNAGIEAFIRQYDRNGDGKVSRAEFGGSAKEFDGMDTDMDAEVTRLDLLPTEAKPAVQSSERPLRSSR